MASKNKYIEVLGESKEHLRTEMTNKALIALRKKYLDITKENPRLKNKLGHFNLMMKRKSSQEVSEFLTVFLKWELFSKEQN